MEDIDHTVSEFRGLLRAFLDGGDRLLVHYFEFTDRVGHILWRCLDPSTPPTTIRARRSSAPWWNGPSFSWTTSLAR